MTHSTDQRPEQWPAQRPEQWVVRPLVPEAVYTDRSEFMEYFHENALNAARRRARSTVMLGRRRMGKTEIFKRVVNRLFFEQDPHSPEVVIPVYFSFQDKVTDARRFAVDYLENFIRYYVGFLTRQPDIVALGLTGENLLSAVAQSRNRYPFTRMLDWALEWLSSAANGDAVYPERTAVEAPRKVADIDDATIVVFLDEFQNIRLPQHDFDIVGFMREAVESPACPHFVTGSAMSILAREIIGRGAMFGRFMWKEIHPLTGYWGAELARKVAGYRGVTLPEIMAPVVADRCGGNPYYITAVIEQAAQGESAIADEQTLNRLLSVDLSSGFIWGELHDQVSGWIERINQRGITKWALYLSALDESADPENPDRLDVARIQREISRREGRQVPMETIRDVLIKLSRGDLLEYLELGGSFRRVKDPILLAFLKVWGQIEVEGWDAGRVRDRLTADYQRLERRFHEYKGYLAEVFMAQALWNGQRKTLPGAFFHSETDIAMPPMFIYVAHRFRVGAGSGREIDVLGAAGAEKWICQSKWRTGRRCGVDVLREMTRQEELLREEMDPQVVRLWLFAHDGLTTEAGKMAREKGILWSNRSDLNGLLGHLGLRPLPALDD